MCVFSILQPGTWPRNGSQGRTRYQDVRKGPATPIGTQTHFIFDRRDRDSNSLSCILKSVQPCQGPGSERAICRGASGTSLFIGQDLIANSRCQREIVYSAPIQTQKGANGRGGPWYGVETSIPLFYLHSLFSFTCY